MARQRVQLVPERLGVDTEPPTRHLLHLAGQGQVVGILGHGHSDSEVDRVAPAGNQLAWPERGLDALAAATGVLLAAVADDTKGALDDVDLLGVLEVPGPLRKLATAFGTHPIGLVEHVDAVDHRQLGLLTSAVASPLRGCAGGLLARALLGGRAEEFAGAGVELLPEETELLLDGADGV